MNVTINVAENKPKKGKPKKGKHAYKRQHRRGINRGPSHTGALMRMTERMDRLMGSLERLLDYMSADTGNDNPPGKPEPPLPQSTVDDLVDAIKVAGFPVKPFKGATPF